MRCTRGGDNNKRQKPLPRLFIIYDTQHGHRRDGYRRRRRGPISRRESVACSQGVPGRDLEPPTADRVPCVSVFVLEVNG